MKEVNGRQKLRLGYGVRVVWIKAYVGERADKQVKFFALVIGLEVLTEREIK